LSARGIRRVVARNVDQVDQHAAPFDVAEEPVTDPRAIGGAFDQPRNIREHEFAPLVRDHAQLRD